MIAIPALGDIVSLATDPLLHEWGVAAALDARPLDGLGAFASDAFAAVFAARGGSMIHPTAKISPLAHIGPNVVIGPGCIVHEFSTVRHSVLSAGVQIGFGCEVTHSVIAQETRLAHTIHLGHSIVGQSCHLSAQLVIASTHLWCQDMGNPDREVTIRLADGTVYGTGLVKFGAILADRVRIAMGVTMGPGVVVGTATVLYPGVRLAATVLPAGHVVRPAPVSLSVIARCDRVAAEVPVAENYAI
ncbi:hypothetical protein [Acrocarpospora sp. B8E8]|uniref:hypothetical protein n=1 Tax=Acrocarpospora sp. B8E8 TaxID=3153572 RepID=UPI00325CD375